MSYILLVEDHDELRTLLAELFEPEPVVAVRDERSALSVVSNRSDRPAVLVTDFHLPDGDGGRLADAVRSRVAMKVPVLFITGSDDAELPSMDVAFALRKPFDMQLARRLVALLARGHHAPAGEGVGTAASCSECPAPPAHQKF